MAHATPVLDAKVAAIAGEMRDASGGVGFDPASLIAIITTIMELFQGCNLTPAQAERRAANPRLLDRLRLRRLISQHSSGDGEALEAALLDAGADLTKADVTALYAETHTHP